MPADDREALLADRRFCRGRDRLRLVAIGRHRRDAHELRLELQQHTVELEVLLEPHVEDPNLVLGDHRRQVRQRDRLREPNHVFEPEAPRLERRGLYKQNPHVESPFNDEIADWTFFRKFI